MTGLSNVVLLYCCHAIIVSDFEKN